LPFCSIKHISQVPDEEEYLFGISAVFQLLSVEILDDRIWHIHMYLDTPTRYFTVNIKPIPPIELPQNFLFDSDRASKHDLIAKT
jgi:hypothetical protein